MDATEVVTRFNAAINARDIESLGLLMTDDHVFVDAAGDATHGRAACICAFEPLHGPALWAPRVRGDQVCEWRVFDDTPATRASLALV